MLRSGGAKLLMWTLLGVGVVASIAFGSAAVLLNLWADSRPLTDEPRSRLDS